MLPSQVRRDLLAVLFDQVADPEQDLGAAADGRGAPGGECSRSDRDGCVDLLDGGEVDLSRECTGGGVVDRAFPARGAGNTATSDPMADAWRAGRLAGDLWLGGLSHRDGPRLNVDVRVPRPWSYFRTTTSGRVARQSYAVTCSSSPMTPVSRSQASLNNLPR